MCPTYIQATHTAPPGSFSILGWGYRIHGWTDAKTDRGIKGAARRAARKLSVSGTTVVYIDLAGQPQTIAP